MCSQTMAAHSRPVFWLCLLTAIVRVAPAAPCQAPTPPAQRLGILIWQASPKTQATVQGLRKVLGRRAGAWEFHSVDCHADSVRAAEGIQAMRRRGVVAIVAVGTRAALTCKRQVKDIPIVFTAVTDPLLSGLVESWTSSGANLTGNSNRIPPARVLRAFRTALPRMQKLGALLTETGDDAGEAEVDAMFQLLDHSKDPRFAAIQLLEEVVLPAQGLEGAVARLAAQGADAIWINQNPQIARRAAEVFAAARAKGIPVVTTAPALARDVAVVAVAPDHDLLGQRAAVLVRRVVAGEQPASIPIGTMRSQHVLLNLDAARRSLVTVPLRALVRADEIIDSRGKGEARGR